MMLRGLSGGGLRQGGGGDVDVFFDMPVFITQVAPTKAALTAYVTVRVSPQDKTPRSAKAGEVRVSLWDAPASTWVPEMGADGGFNQKVSQDTDSFGKAVLVSSVRTGWCRVVAHHLASGSQVMKAFWVDNNNYRDGTISSQIHISSGKQMPAEFQQVRETANLGPALSPEMSRFL